MGDAAVGQRVKTAAAGVRELAVEAARVGADAAARAVEITDRKVAEGADELAAVGRKATKDWDKGTRASRRELRVNSVAARDEVLARAAKMRDPGRKAAEAVAAVVSSTGDSSRKRRKTVATAKKDLTAALAEAKSAAKGERDRKPRWPWLVAVAVVGAGVAVILRAKRTNPLVEQDKFEGATPKEEAVARVNGHAATPQEAPKPPVTPVATPPSTAPKPPVTPPKPAVGAAKPPAKPTAAPDNGTKKPAASPENTPKR
ncbi:hypothetical protein VA596_47685 [Amycolatopsis sp., V23-08]|uniref:Uncharacterized protein n=1 Tax=Amycolatopsis heterodermiae TaxID=3110235 RepID=A0ABU5RLW5_9PSEU|nr:hypothetical protein [Amycolatopsis sp., V23-08]MEA5367283.1 hypothetical protein [Amycolatopsis sp., V23-08]